MEIRVPLATYTPWNLRWGLPGPRDELSDFLGTFAPLPRTEAERARNGDPRPSIAELYAGFGDYRRKVEKAAEALIREGFLLERDRRFVLKRAGELWRWVHAR